MDTGVAYPVSFHLDRSSLSVRCEGDACFTIDSRSALVEGLDCIIGNEKLVQFNYFGGDRFAVLDSDPNRSSHACSALDADNQVLNSLLAMLLSGYRCGC